MGITINVSATPTPRVNVNPPSGSGGDADIAALKQRMTAAEGNITTLQTDKQDKPSLNPTEGITVTDNLVTINVAGQNTTTYYHLGAIPDLKVNVTSIPQEVVITFSLNTSTGAADFSGDYKIINELPATEMNIEYVVSILDGYIIMAQANNPTTLSLE